MENCLKCCHVFAKNLYLIPKTGGALIETFVIVIECLIQDSQSMPIVTEEVIRVDCSVDF